MLLSAFGGRDDGESRAGHRGITQASVQHVGEGATDERRDVDAVDRRVAGVVDVEFGRHTT